jgi:hypothetical protein
MSKKKFTEPDAVRADSPPTPEPDSTAEGAEVEHQPDLFPLAEDPPKTGPAEPVERAPGIARAASSTSRPGGRREGAGGGSGADHGGGGGDDPEFADTVTILEITPPEEGGIRERALPGDRSLSPPSPPPARRLWKHPAARWAAYVVVVIALTIVFLLLLTDVFRLG